MISLALLAFGGYLWVIHSYGAGFVHGDTSKIIGNIQDSSHAATSYPNRITSAIKYQQNGYKFDISLDSFLSKNNSYQFPDTIKLPEPIICGCDCPSFEKKIYFNKTPREVYDITFASEDVKEIIVDVVFKFKNGIWTCKKTTFLDNLEKARIKQRLDTEILKAFQ